MLNLKFFKGKKIFITGHTGFKGSWLAYILYLSGAKVAGYSLKPKNKVDNFYLLKYLQRLLLFPQKIDLELLLNK